MGFIVVAADKVFARDGFDDATTEEVARVAGVSIGTLYRYFPAKEALMQALLERRFREELARFAETLSPRPGRSLRSSIEDVVTSFIDVQTRFFSRYRANAIHSSDPGKGLVFLAASHERVDAAATILASALAPYREAIHPENLQDASALVIWAVVLLGRVSRRPSNDGNVHSPFAGEIPKLVSRYLLKPRTKA